MICDIKIDLWSYQQLEKYNFSYENRILCFYFIWIQQIITQFVHRFLTDNVSICYIAIFWKQNWLNGGQLGSLKFIVIDNFWDAKNCIPEIPFTTTTGKSL